MSKRRFFPVLFLAIVLTVMLVPEQGFSAPPPATPADPEMEDYCIVPPFIGKTAPPLVMMMVQKDHKLFTKAYDDHSDLDGDGVWETTYKHSIDYYGYFDSYKCYTYDSAKARFVPQSFTSNKYCNGQWSGNFLNWATMTRVDIMRKVFFGGLRGVDNSTATPSATLRRAFLPQDSHSFVKSYSGDGLFNDLSLLTPYGPGDPINPVENLTICNTTKDSYDNPSTPSPPLMRVATNSTKPWPWSMWLDSPEFSWATGERWQCAYAGELTSLVDVDINGSFDFDTVGWSTSNATATIVGGGQSGNAVQLAESSTTSPSLFFRDIPTNPGSTYELSLYMKGGTLGGAYYEIWDPINGTWYWSEWSGVPDWRQHSFRFKAESSTTRIEIYFQDWDAVPGETFLIDEVRLQEFADAVGKEGSSSGEYLRPDPRLYSAPNWDDKGNKIGDFVVEVEACKYGLLGKERCRFYEQHSNYMPIGLVQKYGEDSSMYFGLITGSYDFNKTGGILRAELQDFGDLSSSDVNRSTGMLTANAGIWPTIKALTISNYSYDTGTYGSDDSCPEGLSDFTNGSCSNWGNPLGEMYFEAIRYFAGKTSPLYGGTDTVNLTSPSPSAWTLPNYYGKNWPSTVDPFSRDNIDSCSQPFVLIVSDTTPSYDSDEIPNVYSGFDSFVGSNDISGFSAYDLADEIGAAENINGGQFFVGQSGATDDNQCTAKTVTSLGAVRGICPAGPGTEGSYYLASAAYFGRKNDIRPDVVGDQNVNAYAVVLGKGLPEININVSGNPVTVIPACFNRKTEKPCALIDIRASLWNDETSGQYYITWEDSQQGGDYDMDAMMILYYNIFNGQVEVSSWYGNESGDMTLDMGYIISGTTDDGPHLDLRVNNDPPVDEDGDLLDEYCYGQWGMDNDFDMPTCWSYDVFTPGASTAAFLKDPLWYAAKYGGFIDINDNGAPDLQAEWDSDGNGVPDSYFDATKPQLMEAQLESALTSMLRRVTSGTAASVLASGEGSGANLVQAVYYPRRRFFSQEINWLGSLQNLWYFVDPFFQYSSIREDSTNDKKLNLTNDYLVSMYYDSQSRLTRADLYQDADGDGAIDDINGDGSITRGDIVGSKEFADISNLWEAGMLLWKRDLAADPRNIYYNDGTSPSAVWSETTVTSALSQFTNSAIANLIPLMNVPDMDGSGDSIGETTDIINYTLGYHLPYTDRNLDGLHDYRNRYADIDLNKDGDTYDAGEINEWKLGDIIDSTPKIASHVQIHYYDRAYGDATYNSKVAPADSYVESDNYQRRGMVYVGANDGMLHAFKLGDLRLVGDPDWATPGANEVAWLAGSGLGREEWAYIPLHVLPYLKYIAENDYCHLLSVDLSPYIFDASIAVDPDPNGDGSGQTTGCSDDEYWNCQKSKNSWRTILIGGLRLGGACRNRSVNCSSGDCVNIPAETDYDSDGTAEGIGYSSYFALDITEQYDAAGKAVEPKLLWEFSHDELGTSYSGPAIVRINGWADDGDNVFEPLSGEVKDNVGKTLNGRWIVVVGSGPTGPISEGDHQFLGRSDQNLKIFPLDLKTGELLTHDGMGNNIPIDTGIPNAFAGSMINVTHDNFVLSEQRQDYEDELLYIGYTEVDTSPNPDTWTKGGIGRLVTNGSADPKDWVWSEVIKDIGPVNAAAAKLENIYKDMLWVYFGTGRFFYKQLNNVDDMYEPRTIFGITDPCFYDGTYDPTCTTTVSKSDLTDVSWIPGGTTNSHGWYISLDDTAPNDPMGSERVITDVLSSTSGLVFFTTFQPYTGACSLGGKSYLWAVKYDTGGDPGALLQGKGLVQVSTGAIEEIDLRGAFKERGNRRTVAMEGVPPAAQGLSIISPPNPVKRTIHVRER